jgi:flavin-dependent dehydrogenase
MLETSVCIIGAGPAGLSASLFLSKAGIDHVVLDRQSFPRDKVCGESFDGKVFHMLQRLDPSWLRELEAAGQVQKCRSYSLTNSWGHKMGIRFSADQTPKLHVKRLVFDHFLLQKAQAHPTARIQQQTNVRKIIQQKNGVLLKTDQGDVFTQLLIVSSGANALLKNFFKPPQKHRNAFLFARGYFRDIQPVSDQAELEIFFIRRPFKGCLLLCPMPGGETNVEIGMETKEWRRHRQPLDVLLKAACQQPFLHHRFKEARQVADIRTTAMELSTAPRQYAKDRILLAGSAAGSVNPVTGFGVGHAMTMGMLAAQQATEALKRGDFSYGLLRGYEKKVKSKLKKEIWISHTITRLQKQIDLLEPLIFLMSKGKALANILSDKDLVENICNPKFYWKHWRAAISKKE